MQRYGKSHGKYFEGMSRSRPCLCPHPCRLRGRQKEGKKADERAFCAQFHGTSHPSLHYCPGPLYPDHSDLVSLASPTSLATSRDSRCNLIHASSLRVLLHNDPTPLERTIIESFPFSPSYRTPPPKLLDFRSLENLQLTLPAKNV